MSRLIEKIRDDQNLGASELAELALDLLGQQTNFAGAKKTADQLIKVRPSMAPIANWSRRFMNEISGSKDFAVDALKIAMKLKIEKAEILGKQAEHAWSLFVDMKTLVTLSYSSTVIEIVRKCGGPDLKIVVAESRPGYEGRQMAAVLAKSGVYNVTVVTDAAAAFALKNASALLLGADTITSDGAAINKTGSFVAALVANDLSVPVYIAADSYKINQRFTSDDIHLEEKSPDEVWQDRPESVSCKNIYFEPVPARLITAYITEKGILPTDQLFDKKS